MSDGNGTSPARPQLADPASQPRHALSGRQQRGKPIYSENAGIASSDLAYWEVEVTPLEGASSAGRGFDAEQSKRGVIFEVRALYYGTGLPEFGSQPNTRCVPHVWEEDQELAIEVARRFTELLQHGDRPVATLLPELAAQVKERRG